jgi:hypothetical protein
MNIIQAIREDKLFRPFLEDGTGSLDTWLPWMTALRVLYGLPAVSARHALITQCTGRDPGCLPDDGFSTALLLTGRRSGKSRIAAIIGAYEAVLAGHQKKLAKGERGVVAICAPSKPQGRVVKDYLRAIFETPLLHAEVVTETKDSFYLRNNTRIEILAGDFRTVRGYTTLAAIVDEIAFFGIDDEAKVKSDTELIRAIKPSLATVGGKLIAITSPYARKGWTYKTFERNYGNNLGTALVWNCPSRTLNPTLSQKIIDEALAEDRQSALSEYFGQFRDDVGEFIARSVIENLVVDDRTELLPRKANRYYAFCDVSGGRGDDAALAIAHRQGRKVVIDLLRRYRPPFSPYEVCGRMATELKRFGAKRVVGDNYSAEFVAQAFASNGIHYDRAEKNKSQLYQELLPRLCSGEIELLDDEALVNQLAGLERRTRSGGKDIIDHPRGGHDDVANAVAGCC